MDVYDGMAVDEIICVYMEYGDDFHECVERVAREKDIRAGAVLSAVGTFDQARIHHIVHTGFPAEDEFVTLEGPIELCSVDGVIADHKPHMHATMALRGDELFAGHLEPGCRVLYLAEAVIAKFAGRAFVRDRHPEHGTPRLTAEGGDTT
jgi:predicted DNA-binding protein with PD1-like motif